jgi:hypothetical protein
MTFSKLILIASVFAAAQLHADDTFDIVDGSASVSGRPSYSATQARSNWDAACEQWKTETKEFNNSDHIMMLSCQTPSCAASENGETTCTSTAVFKVKTSGTRVQASAPSTPVVTSPVEPVIVATTIPAPRAGYVWIGGYWGYRNYHHEWIGGHYEHRRPGYVYRR